jgi:DNA-binding MarR family transcriptional regulator
MHIALQIFHTAQCLEQAARRTFAPHGLTLAQFNVLNLLSDQPRGLCAKDLAGALIVDPSNITGLLRRMARDGLVRNLPNTTDRRQRIVALTPAGRRKWRKALGSYEANLRELSAALPPGEAEAVGTVLDRLREKAAAMPM